MDHFTGQSAETRTKRPGATRYRPSATGAERSGQLAYQNFALAPVKRRNENAQRQFINFLVTVGVIRLNTQI
jgi:hypothetical protein